MGGAGTGAGGPPLDPVLPDELDEELDGGKLPELPLEPVLPPVDDEPVLDDPLDDQPPVEDQPADDEPLPLLPVSS